MCLPRGTVSSCLVTRTSKWVMGIVLFGAGAVSVWWGSYGRRSLVQNLEPNYVVTKIDLSGKTMVLQKASHRYVVSCQEHCAWFSDGKSYQMRNVVNGLECDTGNKKITLPILQEDVDFPSEGGRG